MKAMDEMRRIVRQHYGLKRPATEKEVRAEIAMLRRRGRGNLDDSQESLAAKLDVFREVNPKALPSENQVELHTWFERDRSHVELRRKDTGETVVEWWDEDVAQAIEDGFLRPKNYFGSAVEYAREHGLMR